MYTNLAAFVSTEVSSNVILRLECLHRVNIFVPRGHRDEVVDVQEAASDHSAERSQPENSMVPSTSRHEGDGTTIKLFLKIWEQRIVGRSPRPPPETIGTSYRICTSYWPKSFPKRWKLLRDFWQEAARELAKEATRGCRLSRKNGSNKDDGLKRLVKSGCVAGSLGPSTTNGTLRRPIDPVGQQLFSDNQAWDGGKQKNKK